MGMESDDHGSAETCQVFYWKFALEFLAAKHKKLPKLKLRKFLFAGV
jgi:hypothetical protein